MLKGLIKNAITTHLDFLVEVSFSTGLFQRVDTPSNSLPPHGSKLVSWPILMCLGLHREWHRDRPLERKNPERERQAEEDLARVAHTLAHGRSLHGCSRLRKEAASWYPLERAVVTPDRGDYWGPARRADLKRVLQARLRQRRPPRHQEEQGWGVVQNDWGKDPTRLVAFTS